MTTATGFSGSQPGTKTIAITTVTANRRHPFLKDQPVAIQSGGAATLYGANHPGTADTTQYASFRQSISGNKVFVMPTALDTPLQTVSGAVAVADQLRTVVLVDGAPLYHSRDDQVAASGGYVFGAGGGTAAGEAIIIKGTTAADLLAGSVLMSIARGDAGTQTILVGDKLEIAGDSTDYYCTETSQALNGTTEVEVSITPPLQQAVLANAVVTVTASDDNTLILNAAPSVGALVEVMVFAAADITAITGGTMTADRIYDVPVYDYMTAGVAAVNMSRLHN